MLGIENPGGIGPIVGTPHLAGAFGDFGKRAKHNPGLVCHPNAFTRTAAGCKRATHPECAFIQVWKEFGADGPAQGEHQADTQAEHAYTYSEPAALDCKTNMLAIGPHERGQHRVMPLASTLAKEHTGEHRPEH